MRTAIAVLAALLACRAPLAAQVPGEYPHLVLADSLGQAVPGPGGPFDNSGVFQAFSGLTFEARASYQSAGQANTNVLWGLFISAAKTAFPTNTIPPQLLTQPPMIMVLGNPPTLDAAGHGTLALFVPAGLHVAQTYLQGLVYDSTSVPHVRLSNGLTVTVQVPDYNVRFSFARSKQAGGDGQLHDLGTVDIDSATLKTLKPIGTTVPPLPIAGAAPLGDDYRFLPVAPNDGDAPVNPRARPMTRIVGSVTTADTTIPVLDTTFFPRRGRLLVALDSGGGAMNLWTKKTGGGDAIAPGCEVVAYDGTTPTAFLNCQRAQVGTNGLAFSGQLPHVDGQVVLGYYTMATTSGARGRQRVSLDADNVDMPHVVIPAFTVDGGEGGGPVTHDNDLYLYETLVNKLQGFMTFERGSGTWRAIPGTEKASSEGVWEPLITVAPDGRSFVAVLSVPKGPQDGWNFKANRIFAVRLDGLHWPASGAESWEITWQLEADPTSVFIPTARARRPYTLAMSIVGSTPDDYVLYAGLAHKWKINPITQGSNFETNKGYEFEYVQEEVIVRDLIECPLVQPGSAKSPPSMPRPWITTDFGLTGFGNAVFRFDPDLLPSPDHTRLLVTGGPTAAEEEVFCVRNVFIQPNGTVSRIIANLSGYSTASTSAGRSEIRPFAPGGHGQGRRACFSPDGTRAAWVVRDKSGVSTSNQNRDWIDIGFTSGASYGKIKHTYATTAVTPQFKMPGPMAASDRAVFGLKFISNTRLVFTMGKLLYDDPAGLQAGAVSPNCDVFTYDITANLMTNLTHTDGTVDGFGLGKIAPAGFFDSPDGAFTYILRAGKLALPAPADVHVMNVIGIDNATGTAFAVSGSEFGGGSLIPDLDVSATEVVAPVEAAAPMRFVEGSGAQDGILCWASPFQGGNGGDNVIVLNRKTPFVAFAATDVQAPGVRVSNIVPDPYGGKVAFARTDTPASNAANQHPFVVDLDAFLFERDLTPTWTLGGGFWGRVMDGSFHFIPPSGTAGEALVFAFGLGTIPETGIALIATPAYYPLAGVSNLLIEPVPVLVPLINTELLGTDYRFYIPAAGLSQAP